MVPLMHPGEAGDVAELKGATGQAPKWAPPERLLEYVRVPGHAPGQMALLHKPSGSLLMADTLANLGGGLLKKAPPQLGLVPPGVMPFTAMVMSHFKLPGSGVHDFMKRQRLRLADGAAAQA